MSGFMDLLLKADKKTFEFPKKTVKIKRFGEGAELTIRALPFDKIEQLREEGNGFRVKLIREAVTDFDFSAPALREKLSVDESLPSVEVIKKLFTAGEIEELYLKISQLSGYGADTVEEIKKK